MLVSPGLWSIVVVPYGLNVFMVDPPLGLKGLMVQGALVREAPSHPGGPPLSFRPCQAYNAPFAFFI